MSSQWYCRILDSELGPIGFSDLAEMVRSGSLGEDDLVRQSTQPDWKKARDVIGLFHAAARSEREHSAEAKIRTTGSERSGTPATPAPPSRSRGDPGRRRRAQLGRRAMCLIACVAAVFLLFGWSAWRWHHESSRFPLPAGLRADPAAGHFFLGLGPLTALEFVLLCVDALFAVGLSLYLAMRVATRKPTRET
jgi:hypothetical protein